MRLAVHPWEVCFVASRFFGDGLDAHEIEPQGVYEVEDPVQLRLVDDFSRDDRPTVRGPHLHPLEGRGEPLAELRAHHYLVSAACVGPLSAAALHMTFLDHRFCELTQSSPANMFHPGDSRNEAAPWLMPGFMDTQAKNSPRVGGLHWCILR